MIITLLTFALIIFALVDLITSDNWQVRHLPKVTWVFVILLLPVIGSLIWLFVGKDRTAVTAAAEALGVTGTTNQRRDAAHPSTTELELEALEREIAFHEKQDRLKRLEAELEKKRRGSPDS